jgi:hypothetical protein
VVLDVAAKIAHGRSLCGAVFGAFKKFASLLGVSPLLSKGGDLGLVRSWRATSVSVLRDPCARLKPSSANLASSLGILGIMAEDELGGEIEGLVTDIDATFLHLPGQVGAIFIFAIVSFKQAGERFFCDVELRAKLVDGRPGV